VCASGYGHRMATAPADVAAALTALDTELRSAGSEIRADRYDAVVALVRSARDAREPLDRDAVSLLRVAEACLSGAPIDDLGEVGAALALIARTVTAQVGNAAAARHAATAHSHGTLSAIAELAGPGSKP